MRSTSASVTRGWRNVFGAGMAILAGLLGVALLVVLAMRHGGWQGSLFQPASSGLPAPRTAVTVSEVALHPHRYFGRAITVDGRVNAVIGTHSFALVGDRFFEVGEVLVVHRQTLPSLGDRPYDGAPTVDDLVQVTGTVRRLDRAALERELGVDLAGGADAFLAPWEGKPVIVATSAAAVRVTARIPVVSLDQLLDNPTAYLGQFVAVTGEFDGAVARQAIQIEDDDLAFDEDVLVVTNLALEAIPGWPDDHPAGGLGEVRVPITVRGTVRELDVAALERELGVDLDDERLAPRAGVR